MRASPAIPTAPTGVKIRRQLKPASVNTNLRAAAAAVALADPSTQPLAQAPESQPKNIVEIIPNRFFFISSTSPPKPDEKSFFFSTDKDLVYQPFMKEFGPLNLSQIYRYVVHLEKVLSQEQYATSLLYHYSHIGDNSLRTNAIFLVCCYQMISLKRTAEESWQPFASINPPLQPYKDIHEFPYEMSILDCLVGLEKGMRLGWFSMDSFNLVQYQRMYQFENGDMNWIIPNKFLAFSNPYPAEFDKNGRRRCTIEEVIPRFQQLAIERVVRLNSEEYDADTFVSSGIAHNDLYFTDGTAPPEEIVLKFLKIAESTPGRIAVHCKAGLGRTGTLIGCFAMKHYQFPARAFIGWIRMCRPGSIHGPQNEYLSEKQSWLFGLSASVSIPQKKELIRSIMVKRPISNLPHIQQQLTPELPYRQRKATVALAGDVSSKARSVSMMDKPLPDIATARKERSTTRTSTYTQPKSNSSQKYNLFKSGIFTINSVYA